MAKQRDGYKKYYADIACRLAACGFSLEDIAYALGTSTYRLGTWRKKYQDLEEALTSGKREVKKRVVKKMFEKVFGYNYTDKNVKTIKDKEGNVTRVEESEFIKTVDGDPRLLVFALCNLDRQLGDDEWKSIKKIEVEENHTVNVQIDGKAAREKLQQLAGGYLPQKHVDSIVISETENAQA